MVWYDAPTGHPSPGRVGASVVTGHLGTGACRHAHSEFGRRVPQGSDAAGSGENIDFFHIYPLRRHTQTCSTRPWCRIWRAAVSSKGRFQRFQIVVDSQTDARLDEVVRHAAGGIRAGAFLPSRLRIGILIRLLAGSSSEVSLQ